MSTTARGLWAMIAALAVTGLAAPVASAQETDTSAVRIVDYEAGRLERRIVNGVEIIEAYRVTLREGSSTIRADRLIERGGGLYEFMDRVRIVDEGDTLTADRVLYDRNTRIGRADGRVRLWDGEVIVLAPEGDYDAESKRADFRAGVTLVDSVTTLTSATGSYWTERKRAEFAGAVRLVQDSLRMAADSLDYDREGRVADARSGVVIERRDSPQDTLNVVWIFGDRAIDRDATGRSTVWGDVAVLQLSADSTGASADSLWIRAGRVDIARSDSLDRIVAVDSVRIVRRDLAAVADSVVYRIGHPPADEGPGRRESRLFGRPMAWFGVNQVSGDSMAVVGFGDTLDSLRVSGSAFAARRDSAEAPLQQLKGRTMHGLFERDSLRVLTVTSQAEALYHLAPEEGREGGAVRTSGDRVVLVLDGDAVSDIRIYEGVEGTYYPASLLDASVRLDGPAWQPERRPDAEALRARYLVARCRVDAGGCAPPDETR